MITQAAKLMVCAGKESACIKIIGRANFHLSIDFKAVTAELQRRGLRRFVIDLSECVLMDSTFLGVLTGFGLTTSQANGESSPRQVELLNPNTRVAELLENLGVVHLFKLTQGSYAPVNGTETSAEPCKPSHEELTRTCLEAHQTLIRVNPENAARFTEVTKFLAEDLKKSKDQP
jgi:anti-sigma B factor antagonist